MELKVNLYKMRDRYHIKSNKKVFLYGDEWKRFYNMLSDKQQPYFKIVINTGGRVNEILNLCPKDINKDRKQLTFRITKVKAKLGETKPTPRTIQVSSEFCAWVLRYVKSHNIKTNEPIITMSKVGIHKIIKSKLKEVRPNDYNDFSSHNLRKTHGMWLLGIIIPGIEVAMRLGHDLNTLMKHYASPTLLNYEDKIIIVDELGDLYKDIRQL